MGNMATALASGFIASGKVAGSSVYAYAPHQDKLRANAEKLGFVPCASAEELVGCADIIVVACKPYQIEEVFGKLISGGCGNCAGTAGGLLSGKAILSVAAGWSFEKYKALLGDSVRIQCIMPNTPVSIGRGMILVEQENSLEPEERAFLLELLSSCGAYTELPSRLMGAGMAISGCGPAFFDLIIEALGDGAVKNGIPREQAYELVCATMAGTAELKLETGLHPGVLKDQVCSPAGTTIKGVAALEKAGVRSAFIEAVDAVLK